MANRKSSTSAANIHLSAVCCSLSGTEILHDISLRLAERRVGIVGRNGSGKSTLARVIAGLIRPQTGRVLINDVDVVEDRKNAIQTVGFLFQNPDHQIIFPTVEEEISFGLTQLGKDKSTARAKAQEMLARFGCEAWQSLPVAQLSQGQRHLVCLMSVLVMRPAVLLLDEPFTGLDIPTTRALHRYLENLDQSIVQITHDPSALRGYDRVIWIDRGRVHADGPAEETLQAFLKAMNAQEADIAGA